MTRYTKEGELAQRISETYQLFLDLNQRLATKEKTSMDAAERLPTKEEVYGLLRGAAPYTSAQGRVAISDLDVDSLDLLEWMFEVEMRYEIELDSLIDPDADEMTTFGERTLDEIYDLLRVLIQSKGEDISGQ
jgi:hypothetical protein